MIQTILTFDAELTQGVTQRTIRPALLTHDSQAHQVCIRCTENGQPAQLDGAKATGWFIRQDGSTVMLPGQATGSQATCTLPASCYAQCGRFSLVIKLTQGDTVSTIFWGTGDVITSRTDQLVDDERLLPSLDELLAQIAAMEAATASATTAAQRAEAIANLSVQASTLASGSQATASYANGVLKLGIPKGEKGSTGAPGATSSVNGVSPVNGNVSLTAASIPLSKDDTTSIKTALEKSVSDGKIIYNASISGGISALDAARSGMHSTNRFAFANPEGITVEYSTDGGATWVEQGSNASKIQLVSGIGTNFAIGDGSTVTLSHKLRITFNAGKMGVYTKLRKLLINVCTYGATACTAHMEIAYNSNKDTFVDAGSFTMVGWSGWNSIAQSDLFGGAASGNICTLRLTFGIGNKSTNANYSNRFTVQDIIAIGDTTWTAPSNTAKSGHLYTWDWQQNATFPKAVKAARFSGDLDITAAELDAILV